MLTRPFRGPRVWGALMVIFLALPGPALAKDHVVTLGNGTILIRHLEARLGDAVLFKNSDASSSHSIYSVTPEGKFDLKLQGPSSTRILILDPKHFRKGATLEVRCGVHRDSVMTLTIQE